MDAPVFSRTGTYNPLGKCICTIKTVVPLQVEEDAKAKAASLEMPLQEFLHELLMTNLYGADYVVSLHQERLKKVATVGPSKGSV
jgi:hypothetical protein